MKIQVKKRFRFREEGARGGRKKKEEEQATASGHAAEVRN
jgi:hypothetical protein